MIIEVPHHPVDDGAAILLKAFTITSVERSHFTRDDVPSSVQFAFVIVSDL